MGLLLSTVVENICVACRGTGKYPAYRQCENCHGSGYCFSIRGCVFKIKDLLANGYK